MNAIPRDPRAASPERRRRETRRGLAIVALLCVAALAAIVHLQRSAQAGMHAQMRLQSVARELVWLQDVPFRARPENGGTAATARAAMRAGERRVGRDLAALDRDSPPPQLRTLRGLTRGYFRTLEQIYLVGISRDGYGPAADRLGAISGVQIAQINGAVRAAGRVYARRANGAGNEALIGTGAALALLFCAFACFHRRSAMAHRQSELLAEENGNLLAASRAEARTDPLTGLRNRRALVADLAEVLAEGGSPHHILVLYDLDGFKQYNDTFGHPAGDLLLQRLGTRLQTAVVALGGTAYRMGGDEFCVLAPAQDTERVVWTAWTALSERGDAFEVGASYGMAELPGEAESVKAALRIADVRLYDDKASGRPSADRQSTDVLMALIQERGTDLLEHVERVAQLTELLARRLGLSDSETRQAALAARLHDVGKTAIPDAIIEKPGSLDEEEWRFIHRHTVIGERIIRAAPALEPIAALVRATHERYDGRGYPDGLAGEAIPLAARIIAVCDAYATMTSDHVYQAGVTPAEALAELGRHAGTQFDPQVVDAFGALPADQVDPAERRAA
jgi:diguanylate cyclase (GGDEF)-like protein